MLSLPMYHATPMLLAWKLISFQMVANVANSSTSTNHNNNKAASKWIYQQLEMILIFRQAALALHDTLVVRASIAFGCDN